MERQQKDRFGARVRKQKDRFADHARGITKFWSGLRETLRNGEALIPGKGRRFKSSQLHHLLGSEVPPAPKVN